MSVNSKMTAIADAIRGKTGKTDSLTLDQMATEIAGIETGGGSGGGNMESGEFVGVKGSFNIPVSSKKTHVMMFPQNVNDENGNTNRISYLFANEANYQITLCHGGSSTAIERGENVAVNFTDTNITFSFWSTGIPCNTIPFYWFAW